MIRARPYAHLLERRPEQALALLTNAPPGPQSAWANMMYVTALLLNARYSEALERAAELRDWWRDRLDEFDGVGATAWASAVLGDYEIAERAAAKIQGVLGAEVRALARFLQEDVEGGIEAVRAFVAESKSPLSLDDLTSVFLPTQHALARHRRTTPADLSPCSGEIAHRRRELEQLTDPALDLARAPVDEAEADVARFAQAMGTALLRVAGIDAAANLDPLQALSDEHPDDLELRQLVSLAEEPVATAASEPVWSAVPLEAPRPDEGGLELLLPTSWFDGHDDPLNDHPLFLRYIPEVRARAAWDVPAVRVQTDDALEPDGYRISQDGEVVEEGRVSPLYRYTVGGALDLLDPELAAAAEPAPAFELMRLPAAAATETGDLTDLLTMPAVEVVARRIGDVSRPEDQRIDRQSGFRWSPRRLKLALSRGHASSA